MQRAIKIQHWGLLSTLVRSPLCLNVFKSIESDLESQLEILDDKVR